MEGDPSVTGGIIWALRVASDIAFRWVPGAATAVMGTAPNAGPTPILKPITEPITTGDVVNFLQTTATPGTYDKLYTDWSVLVAIAVILSLLFSALIIYCVMRIMQVRQHENERFRAAGETIAARDVSKTVLRWNRIIEQVRSESEQSWRLAILEADIMLNELLDVLGYKGETMADKMKQIDRAHFKGIDLAWEAHKVRNEIAHSGSMKHLSEREVRRIIGLYEQVFREFHFLE